MLKIYVTAASTKCNLLERERHRNLEVIWFTARLAPDFKTIADFRRDDGPSDLQVLQAVRCPL
jgi:transposase